MTDAPVTSTNQQKTEPVPPTQAHSVPDAAADGPDPAGVGGAGEERADTGERADLGTGTATDPGAREGTMPAVARDGLADGETDNRMPPTSTF